MGGEIWTVMKSRLCVIKSAGKRNVEERAKSVGGGQKERGCEKESEER